MDRSSQLAFGVRCRISKAFHVSSAVILLYPLLPELCVCKVSRIPDPGSDLELTWRPSIVEEHYNNFNKLAIWPAPLSWKKCAALTHSFSQMIQVHERITSKRSNKEHDIVTWLIPILKYSAQRKNHPKGNLESFTARQMTVIQTYRLSILQEHMQR